jgi:thiol-disulfide isomerase/thioredoxin
MTTHQLTRRGFLCAGLVTAAATLGIAGPVAAGIRAGDRPKSVILSDLADAKVALPEAYAGKVVAVHFWATWCPYCVKEIDALQALFSQYRERGCAPVSVNIGESRAVAAEVLRTRTVTYPILLDTDSAAAKLYGVTGIPTTFILDRGGAMAFKILGEINREGLRRILSGLLGT